MKKFYVVLFTLFFTLKGFAQAELPALNNALLFNGLNDLSAGSYIQLPSTGNLLEFTTGTIEMWARPDFVSGNRCLFSQRSTAGAARLSIHMSPDGSVSMWNGTVNRSVNTPFNYNTWTHVAAVITTTSTIFYINGIAVGSTTNGLNSAVTNTVSRIGVAGTNSSDESWKGGIDEVRIWKSARTATEILADKSDISTTSNSNLLAYYDFNQGTANGTNTSIMVATDRTPNNRGGLLRNFALTPNSASNFIEYIYEPPLTAPASLFVNAAVSSSGDGKTWATAKKTLTEALDIANIANVRYSIYIARGTYLPGVNRNNSFLVTRDSIRLFGGYLGNESDLSARDPKVNQTILSADIGIQGDRYDNNYHVLIIASAMGRVISDFTTIDGFTISNGYAVIGSSLNVRNKNIPSGIGGGIVIEGAGPGSQCSPKIANCVIINNTGDGQEASDGAESFDTPVKGGAVCVMALKGRANPEFTNCVFTESGGSLIQGSVMYVYGELGTSSPTISNCLFTGNAGDDGLIWHYPLNGTSTFTINNSTFFNNPADLLIHTNANGINGGIYLNNNIVQFGSLNLFDENDEFGALPSVFHAAYNIFETDVPGVGNINSEDYTYFRNINNIIGADGIWRTVDDGLNLKSCAFAINTGLNSVASATDITGYPRIFGAAVDRGAYEGLPSIIALSTSSVNNQPFLPDNCTGNTWTTYAIPGQPGNMSMAIKWGTANEDAKAAATLTINTDATNTVITSGGAGIAAMRRYWNVDLHNVPLVAPVSVRFYYSPADTIAMKSALNGSGPVSGIRWIKTTGNAYSPSQITLNNINSGNFIAMTPSATGVQDGVSYVEFDNVNSFSGGTAVVTSGQTLLPVTIKSFVAKTSNCFVSLDWTVGDAVGFKHYEVERSKNGTSFFSLGTVAHLQHQSAYLFTDRSPEAGVNYYRLKLVDIDGRYTYSVVQTVRADCGGGLNNIVVGPNPVVSDCIIRFQSAGVKATVNLLNSNGRIVYSQKLSIAATQLRVPMQKLSSGVYMIEIIGTDGNKVTRTLIKQ